MYNPKIGVGGYFDNPVNTYNYQNSINQSIGFYTELYGQRRYDNAWKKGIILIEYPTAIQDMQVDRITSSNSDIQVVGHNTFKKDGKVYLKIYTNSNKMK